MYLMEREIDFRKKQPNILMSLDPGLSQTIILNVVTVVGHFKKRNIIRL